MSTNNHFNLVGTWSRIAALLGGVLALSSCVIQPLLPSSSALVWVMALPSIVLRVAVCVVGIVRNCLCQSYGCYRIQSALIAVMMSFALPSPI